LLSPRLIFAVRGERRHQVGGANRARHGGRAALAAVFAMSSGDRPPGEPAFPFRFFPLLRFFGPFEGVFMGETGRGGGSGTLGGRAHFLGDRALVRTAEDAARTVMMSVVCMAESRFWPGRGPRGTEGVMGELGGERKAAQGKIELMF
jgi:hypothetical protein